MKRLFAAFSLPLVFGACAHAPARAPLAPETSASAPPAVEAPLSPGDASDLLKSLKSLETMCLPRAGYALMLLDPDGKVPPKEARRIRFEAYYNVFLNVRGHQEYVDCLSKNRPENYRDDLKKAQGWLSDSRKQLAELEPQFPPQERIVDVQESFVDSGPKKTTRHLVVTLRSGDKKVIDETFDR